MKEKMKIGNLIIEEDEFGTTIYEDYAYGSIPSIKQLKPTKVIFNDPATIVFWNDGTKTVVKCSVYDTFDRFAGFTYAYFKKIFGSTSNAVEFMEKNGLVTEEPSWFEEIVSSFLKGNKRGR